MVAHDYQGSASLPVCYAEAELGQHGHVSGKSLGNLFVPEKGAVAVQKKAVAHLTFPSAKAAAQRAVGIARVPDHERFDHDLLGEGWDFCLSLVRLAERAFKGFYDALAFRGWVEIFVRGDATFSCREQARSFCFSLR